MNQQLPITPNYGYSYSQSVYLQSELNLSNAIIEKISYHYTNNGSLDNSDNWSIYMWYTSNTSFSTVDSWIPIDQLTEVYSGQPSTILADGWIEFDLNNTFQYNNTDNLVIAIEENQSGYTIISGDFYCSYCNESRSIYYHNDSINPNCSYANSIVNP